MKKQIALLATVALVGAAAGAFAGIEGTKHDLSGKNLIGNSSSQVCIFCHTPHNAIQDVPLWNRNNPCSTYTLYTVSPTLTTATKASAISSTSVSTFCMSCHDGVNAFGNIANTAGGSVGTATPTYATATAKLGTDLTNTHPVGFNYASAAGEDTTGLKTRAAANTSLMGTNGSAFFGTSGNMMECASCHSVHDTAKGYFLRVNNDDSALCLSCHTK